jgi:hypothetical protein
MADAPHTPTLEERLEEIRQICAMLRQEPMISTRLLHDTIDELTRLRAENAKLLACAMLRQEPMISTRLLHDTIDELARLRAENAKLLALLRLARNYVSITSHKTVEVKVAQAIDRALASAGSDQEKERRDG